MVSIPLTYRLNHESNQLNFAGAMKAAELMQASMMRSIKLEKMSQIFDELFLADLTASMVDFHLTDAEYKHC